LLLLEVGVVVVKLVEVVALVDTENLRASH
jgi:hypothetical protein